jgi:hypothetical protein
MDATETKAEISEPGKETEETVQDNVEDGVPTTAHTGILQKLKSFNGLLGGRRDLIIVVSLAIIVILLAWIGFGFLSAKQETATLRRENLKVFSQKADPTIRDSLVKQKMQPFYLELTKNGAGNMARLGFALTCDVSSSKRFEENRILIRDRLYKRLTELAAEGKDIRGMSLSIRSEAQKILEEILRPSELRVVVTGIFIV